MADIHFTCPGCGQSLEASDELANQLIDCPSCNQTIEVPILTATPQHQHPPNLPPSASLPPPAVQLPPDPRRHSIFYYVFWGTVSLFATLLILGVLFVLFIVGMPAFLAGFEAARNAKSANAPMVQSTNVPGGQSTTVPVARDERNPWRFSKDVSAIDDSTSYFLMKKADKPMGSGLMRSTPTIVIRYAEKKLDLYINLDTFVGTDEVPVTVRIGQEAATTTDWSISTDHTGIFYRGNTRAFVESLLKADRLVVRLTPFGESPVTIMFTLTGLPEAIEPMRKVIQ